MRCTIEAEYVMTSVERVVGYGSLRPEADFHSLKDSEKTLAGPITFNNVWLRYAEEEPYVLKGLSFIIREKEKVCMSLLIDICERINV